MTLALHHDRRMVSPSQISSVSALDKFRKYKKEDSSSKRHAVVSGSLLDDLRRRRDMLIGMTPGQAMSVIEFHKNLTLFEAIALAKKEGKLIVPNSVHDRILADRLLTEKHFNGYFRVNYPASAGTMVIYTSPGKPFGARITSGWKDSKMGDISVSFDVPVRFRGKIDCALVLEHPDFDLVSSGNDANLLVGDERRIHLIERFPKKNEDYDYDKRYRLPTGCPISDTDEKGRHLWRSDGDYIGLVVRAYDSWWGWRGIYLSGELSGRRTVALF